jgi:hypothetical protein
MEDEMRSLVRSIGIAAGLLVFAGVQNANAQITGPVEFTTAFPFTVGNTHVPAGSYTITPDDDNPQILELSGGQTAVLFEARDTQTRQVPSKTEVVFNHYGDGYVLKDVYIVGSPIGAEATAGEGERHMAKNHGSPSEQRVDARRKSAASARR